MNSKNKIEKSTELAIQQLCCMGFDSKVFIPKLIELLHEFIFSTSNAYFWTNDEGEVIDIYDDRPESYDYMPLYMEEFYRKQELEVFDGFSSWKHLKGVVYCDQLWRIDRRSLLKHPFYNEFLKNTGYHYSLHRTIWVDSVCCGYIQLKRDRDYPQFSESDVVKLERIAGYIQHGFRTTPVSSAKLNQAPIDKGWVLVDEKGKIHHFSENLIRLLAISSNDAKDVYKRLRSNQLPLAMRKTLQNLIATYQGKHSSPPSITIANEWGEFTLTAQRLTSTSLAHGSDLYQLQIEHREPLRMLYSKNLVKHKLTNRQAQISLEICMGKPYAEIAESLGLMESTIITHKKHLFRKLNVKNRHELSATILNE